jgi:hypothetical protein
MGDKLFPFSLWGDSSFSKQTTWGTKPGNSSFSGSVSPGDAPKFRMPTKPKNSGSGFAMPASVTFHFGTGTLFTSMTNPATPFSTTFGPMRDFDMKLDVIYSFAAKFHVQPGQSVACKVELVRAGWSRRRMRIAKSDSQAVLVDCEINPKSDLKFIAPAKVEVLAEQADGSGRLIISLLEFENEGDAQTFMKQFQ